MKRLVTFLFILGFCLSVLMVASPPSSAYNPDNPEEFYIWLVSDWHNGGGFDKGAHAECFNQSFVHFPEWDIALAVGDITDDGTPAHYNLTIDYYNYSMANSANHTRESVYMLAGNHDGESGASAWNPWNLYADPLGLNPTTSYVNNSLRPFNITNATGLPDTQLYYEIILSNETLKTNIVVLMIGVNVNSTDNGGSPCDYPNEAYNWWVKRLENHTSDIVITCTHHPLEHIGLGSYGVNMSSSDSVNYENYINNTHNESVDLWLNSHNHWGLDYYGDGHARCIPKLLNASQANADGRDFNVTFLNVASQKNNNKGTPNHLEEAHSYLLTFSNGSRYVNLSEFGHQNQTWSNLETSSDQIYTGNTTLTMHKVFTLWRQKDDGSPNQKPIVSNPVPANNSVNISYSGIVYLNFTLTDPDGDTMNYTYMAIPEGCAQSSGANNVPNGTYNITLDPAFCRPLPNGTWCTWYVNVTDGTNSTNATFLFRTQYNNLTGIRYTYTLPGFDANPTGNSVFAVVGVVFIISSVLAIVGVATKFR